MSAENLEKRIVKLEQELERVQATLEIQNLFGRYMYLHSAGKNGDCMELFARNAPGASVEFHVMGLFKGAEGIRKLYQGNMGGNRKVFQGGAFEHTLTTPVIEVAKDGKTAKGLWISPGHETFPGKDGQPEAHWMWCKYGVDFIKEGGRWKIWHYQVFMTFLCSFKKPWTDSSAMSPRQGMPNADGPTTYHKPYTVDSSPEYWPAPPEPYETFEGSRSMVGAPPEEFMV
jgi:hypothetical protein